MMREGASISLYFVVFQRSLGLCELEVFTPNLTKDRFIIVKCWTSVLLKVNLGFLHANPYGQKKDVQEIIEIHSQTNKLGFQHKLICTVSKIILVGFWLTDTVYYVLILQKRQCGSNAR